MSIDGNKGIRPGSRGLPAVGDGKTGLSGPQTPGGPARRSVFFLLNPWRMLMSGSRFLAPEKNDAHAASQEAPHVDRQRRDSEKRSDKLSDDQPRSKTSESQRQANQNPPSEVKTPSTTRPHEPLPAPTGTPRDGGSGDFGGDGAELSLRAYYQRYGFPGVARYVWFDPDKGRPGSLRASLVVNGILAALLAVLVLISLHG